MLEERLLFYVGMTRAKEELILVCGQEPSRFLEEVPESCSARERVQKAEDEEAVKNVQMSLFDFI